MASPTGGNLYSAGGKKLVRPAEMQKPTASSPARSMIPPSTGVTKPIPLNGIKKPKRPDMSIMPITPKKNPKKKFLKPGVPSGKTPMNVADEMAKIMRKPSSASEKMSKIIKY